MLLRFTALALLWIAAAHAEPYRFGGRYLDIPAPEGYVAASAKVPSQIDRHQAPLPAQLRLSDVWFPAEDVKAMLSGNAVKSRRFYELRTITYEEGVPTTEAEFAANLPALENALAQQYSDAGTSDGDAYEGVFDRNAWRLLVATRSTARDGTGMPRVNAIGIVLVNYQVLSLQVSAPLRGPEDAAWVRRELQDWSWKIARANPSDPKLLEAERDAASGWRIHLADLRLYFTLVMIAIMLVSWWRGDGKRAERRGTRKR